jgi:hypothetical protein
MAPLWTAEGPEEPIITIDAFEMVVQGKTISTVYIAGTAFFSSLLALISVFLFKNRQRQLQIGLGNMALISINMMLLVFKAIPDAINELGAAEGVGTYGFGVYFVIVSIILNFLASKMIRKDEALVKSVDRIR